MQRLPLRRAQMMGSLDGHPTIIIGGGTWILAFFVGLLVGIMASVASSRYSRVSFTL